MSHKHQQNINHVNENVNLMVANVTQIKTETMINAHASERTKKKNVCEKGYIQYPATCSCQNGRYRKSVTDDSLIGCDEIMEMRKSKMTKAAPAESILTNFNKKKVICKTKNLFTLLAILLTAMTLSIAISIYCSIVE